jgi:hypothetical protein
VGIIVGIKVLEWGGGALCDSVYEAVAFFCKHSSELMDAVRLAEFLHKMIKQQFLKGDSVKRPTVPTFIIAEVH